MKGIKPVPYTIRYEPRPDAGRPTSSWWLLKYASRAEFDKAVADRREAMAQSRLGRAAEMEKDERDKG